ncbi:MAG TPA: nucleoside triphosphate pyrophosphatase [Nevskiaceae bacterium]|nr:nucleoside triphosphate pyrophosphatase [Nevskiaceae bacterium]
MTDFILASRSPRRVAFLRELGYRFQALPADLPEQPAAGETAPAYAARIALAKARALAAEGRVVLGADTDVVLEGRILGKPADAEAAFDMLMALSGRRHQVISALALVAGERLWQAQTCTEIEFAVLEPAAVRAYCASGEPLDKAGAYAIQGRAAAWVRRVCGSYTGVIGLPLVETVELLTAAGIQPRPEADG